MSIQLKYILDTLADSIIACDHEGKVLQINAAALTLFEVASKSHYRGTFCQQFLHDYEIPDEQQPAISLEPWLFSLLSDEEAASSLQEVTIVLRVPSGREVYTNMYCLPVLDTQKQTVGTIYVFHDITHRYQKALRIQRVHQALSRLTEAIARLPEHMDFASPEGTVLLSPPVLSVAQQLVDVIVEVLDCQQASLLALGPRDGRLYYAVGSSFASEREEYLREKSGCYLPSEFIDETVYARLSANQEVILPAVHLRLPPGFRAEFGTKNLLLIPMLLENQLVGVLMIAKACFDGEYTLEDIKSVKAVALKAMLVIEYLRRSYEQAEMRSRDLVRQEMHRHINEFLNLASHELKTPLTAVKGNIQLAQRSLAKLKRQTAELPEQVREQIERVQYPLESAVQSARLQERIIKNLIDDARIQANTFELHMKRHDLVVFLRETVADAQRLVPKRTIVLDITPAKKTVSVMVDAERITQVMNSYLANALSHSPVDQPVTVHLTVADTLARVSVHDEGPGIPFEEQGRIWERFYNAKGIAAQDEARPGLGLDLYLCRVIIESHHGNVGVHSDPGHGATYWFTLPIEAPAKGKQ